MMDMNEIMQRAREAQAKALEMQREMAAIVVEGQSGGGLVRVTMNGKNEIKRLSIDPSLMKESEREILEDLIVAAHADAKSKLDARLAEEMARMATARPAAGIGFGFFCPKCFAIGAKRKLFGQIMVRHMCATGELS